MNILFLLNSFGVGGVEVVTTVLANKFKKEGNNVVLWAFYESETSLRDRLDTEIPLVYGDGFRSSSNNIQSLKNTIVENKVDIVVNQSGLPFIPAYTLKKAIKGISVKVIAVYHNNPSAIARLKGIENEIEQTSSCFENIVLKCKYFLFKLVTSASMRYIYHHSDAFMVLSPSFINGFKNFTGIKNPTKLLVQTNPITIESNESDFCLDQKENIVLFVGRIDYNQKRVTRIIDTWYLLESKYHNWQLYIVGDGPEKSHLEKMVKDKKLNNVRFEGFQDPRKYYKRASVLILTSEFEGFPLVLPECMSFGVVPVVYGSYPAVYDIIEDGKDGFVVPKTDKGFCAVEMAEKIENLMKNSILLEKMADASKEKSYNYSVDIIYNQWQGKIKRILNNDKS